jgi:hypothetical protein
MTAIRESNPCHHSSKNNIHQTQKFGENNEQIKKMLIRLRERDVKDPITDKFNPTFYRSVDTQDMLNDLPKKYIYKKHAKDLGIF